MSFREFFVLAFVLYILVVQSTNARLNIDEDEDDDEQRLSKRLFFHKSTTASTQRPSSVIGNLIHPSSTKKPSIGTEKSTYPSSSSCALNPCEHGGICIPKGQMTYECKCVGPWRGINCGVVDACYKSPCQNGGTCLNVHDDYWCKCTNDYYGTRTNCQTKFYNPSYSENNCRPNICNTGQCVSLKTSYYCQCPDNRYGEHCEKRFSKRGVSSIQSYYDFIHQLKRGMVKQDVEDKPQSEKGHDVAFYDVKNGIYF